AASRNAAALPMPEPAPVIYVIFLAFAFHGQSHWQQKQAEFGFFIDHFTFLAGLLFAAVHGPERWALKQTLLR
ncbi:hypothetical protein ACC740_38690, partial [Rhizobium ruizarguesonis]